MSLDLNALDEVRDKLFMRLGVSTSWGQVHDELIGRGVMVIGDTRADVQAWWASRFEGAVARPVPNRPGG